MNNHAFVVSIEILTGLGAVSEQATNSLPVLIYKWPIFTYDENMDLPFIICLGLYGAHVFQDRAYFGWCLASLILYSVFKTPMVILLMFCIHGRVFPISDEMRIHLPSGTFAAALVSLIYFRCYLKRNAKTKEDNDERPAS